MELPVFSAGTPWQEAQREFARRGLGDGHPVVPVTEAGLDRMLAGVADPGRSYGQVPPGLGDLNPLTAAYFATLAGCPPAALPTTLSALVACLNEQFNLLGVLTTTSAAAVTVVVGANSAEARSAGSGLGPGRQDTVTIGRAVALALRGLGLASAGLTPMSTVGQPGQLGSCLTEGTHPLAPPLHVRRGFTADESCVTVFATTGFVEIEDSAQHQAATIAQAFRDAVAHRARPHRQRPNEELLVVPLEVADTLQAQGWTLARLEAEVAATDGATTERPVSAVIAGEVGWKCGWLPGWVGGSRSVTAPVLNLASPR